MNTYTKKERNMYLIGLMGQNVIYNIIREETMPFFEGEYTAEKTAEIIQNRVSIYLSEKYG